MHSNVVSRKLVRPNFYRCAALLGVAVWLAMESGAAPAFAQSVPVTAGYRDFYFGTAVNGTPTGEKPQSKLWWNDGIWWGSLWDRALHKHAIHQFDVESQSWTSTGTAIDDRANAKADALWDGQRLYVVSQVFTNNPGPAGNVDGGRLYRYSYDAAAQSYKLDPGFPVLVNNSISETLVLAKDSTGKLWVTWTEGGRVKINRTLGDDLSWGTPFDLPVQGGAVLRDDISTILAFGGNKIGVTWSNQNDRTTYFAVHRDGNADELWQPRERALSDSTLNQISYDHINLKPACDNDGNVYAVTKTSLTRSSEPLIFMLKRNTSGVWSRHLFSIVSDGHTRPILLIDGEHRKAYVFAPSKASGAEAIYMKSTDLGNIAFPPGLGTPFIQSDDDTTISNPTSTKQCLNSETGLLVLASDQNTRAYLHNYLDLYDGPKRYKLAVNTIGSGQVSLNPAVGPYEAGTIVRLAATPANGFRFYGWGGDLSGAVTPATVNMNANKNITAVFTSMNGGGALTHEETGTGGASNAIAVKTAKGLDGATSQLYLAAIATKPQVSVTRVTGLGLKWRLVREQCAGRNTTGLEVWMAQGVPTGNDTVTCTLAATANNAAIAVTRYSGVDPINPIGFIISGNSVGAGGACEGGTDGKFYSFNVTASKGAMIYCAATMRNQTHMPGAGFTEQAELAQGSLGASASIAVADRYMTSSSTVAASGSFSGNVDWAIVALEIKPLNITEVDDDGTGGGHTPSVYRLEQNYPNPFSPRRKTQISFSLLEAGVVTANIYNETGQLVRTLVRREFARGAHQLNWDGRYGSGHAAAAGVYFCRIMVKKQSGETVFVATKRMALLK